MHTSLAPAARARVTFVVVVTGMLVWATLGATAYGRVSSRRVDRAAAFTVLGAERKDYAEIVAPAGDVNGDGHADLLVAASNYPDLDGQVYVLLGPLRGDVSLADLGDRGFVISGGSPEDFATQVSAGDVNGDGLDDVIVGAPGSDNNGRQESGTVYVVFGKVDIEDVALAEWDANTQGDAGYRIDGAATLDLAGISTDGLGDVNQDGLDDVLVGSPFAGAAYVVFGKMDGAPVDLSLFDMGVQLLQGYRIDHPFPEQSGDYGVSFAGDVNGDGIGDALVGVVHRRGLVSVVYGKSSPAPVDIRSLGENGFLIRPSTNSLSIGRTVDAAGDVDGDGFGDVIVGAPLYGKAFVVRGAAASKTVRLGGRLDGRGFAIKGSPDLGSTVAAAGDFNGDSLDDVLVANPNASTGDRLDSGSVYVIFGKRNTRPVLVRDLSAARGIRYHGEFGAPDGWCGSSCMGDSLGVSISAAGDVDSDGFGDAMVAAHGVRHGYRGKAYVILGRPNRS